MCVKTMESRRTKLLDRSTIQSVTESSRKRAFRPRTCNWWKKEGIRRYSTQIWQTYSVCSLLSRPISENNVPDQSLTWVNLCKLIFKSVIAHNSARTVFQDQWAGPNDSEGCQWRTADSLPDVWHIQINRNSAFTQIILTTLWALSTNQFASATSPRQSNDFPHA